MIQTFKCKAIVLVAALGSCAVPEPVNDIYWSDGDSGRYDGNKFRLANIDAPETGGVGSRGGAKCEAERDLGYEAKAFMVEATRTGQLEVIWSGETDRYDRRVVSITVNGQSVSEMGVNAGHLKPWPHLNGRALADKPRWCG